MEPLVMDVAVAARRMPPVPSGAFYSLSALLFLVSATVTIVWCGSMSAMGGMPMPGGWTMSMAWMRMPGQSWAGATAAFVGMWAVMMIAMMLPSLVPMLQRYRVALAASAADDRRGGAAPSIGRLTMMAGAAGAAYFSVWTLCGVAIFPIGIALATLEMRQPAVSRAVPLATALIVIAAGALQLTRWKAHQLACCREAPRRDAVSRVIRADAMSAWRHGLRLGLDCARCCANLTAILLVCGVMEPRTMAIVTVAITAERLAPPAVATHVARAIGGVIIAAGLLLLLPLLAR